MAFSTQRTFLHVPFFNECPQQICSPMETVKLKTYACTHDERSWARSDEKKAQYLIDLVSCRMYDDDAAGDGLQEDRTDRLSEPDRNTNEPNSSHNETFNKKEVLHSIKAEKDDLKSRLEESQEKLEILKEERKALNAALIQDHHPQLFTDIKRKISHLRNSSKIDKNDENELLKMLDGLHKDERAFNALNVQNNYLRRSVEKLSLRSGLTSIPVEPETNTDINYLQNEVNNLRKEVALLRSFEEETFRKETMSRESQSIDHPVDGSSESIDNIKAERNALREKCDSFASVEGKILEWKNDAEQFKCFRKKACLALKQKDDEIQYCRERIEEIEFEFKEMIKCFKAKEMEREALCSANECLKEKNQRLKEEICRCNCDLKGITALQNQVQLLSNELCEKDCAIERYDMQFQQLLGVIESLQNKESDGVHSLRDVDSQSHNENIEELAASTRATLNQISKELEHRQELEADLAQSKAELEIVRRESQKKEESAKAELKAREIENQTLKESLQKTRISVKQSLEQLNLEVDPNEDCCAEVDRLKEVVTKMKSEHENEIELLKKKSIDLLQDLENEKRKGTGVESLSYEANNLKEALASTQDENRQLQYQIQDLRETLEESQNKVKAQQEQIKNMEQRTTELLCSSEEKIKEVGKLVNDINNVQDRNENLKSVLEVVDYSEQYKKEIEDLKKLLDEETKKSQQAVEQNKKLLDEEKRKCQLLEDQNKKLLDEEIKKSQLLSQQNKDLQKDLDQAKEIISSQKTSTDGQNLVEENKGQRKDPDQGKGSINSQRTSKGGEFQTFRAGSKASDGQEKDLALKSLSKPSDALMPPGPSSDKKNSTKLAQLQKIHEATRNAERIYYEKEIEGHRLSNELLKTSLTKLTSKVQTCSAADFEREMRSILDNFAKEICQWRCEKNFKKLTKLQEICKKILEHGIYSLAYKELVYLHQKMSEAALKLKPNCLSSSSSRREYICCKCSGQICEVPIVPKENKILLEKMSILEREIQSAREDLRKKKEEKELNVIDSDQTDPDTLRAYSNQPTTTTRLARRNSSKPKSSRFSYKIKEEEFEIPTKDKSGW